MRRKVPWLYDSLHLHSYLARYSTNMPSIVSQAIPAPVPVLGGSNPDGKVEDEAEAGPPRRPEHDVQIEEFVREQHRSKFAGEMSNS